MLALVSLAGLGVWGKQPGRADRNALVAGIMSVGALAFIVNVLAPSVGWWGGRIFEAPLFPLALLTALRAIVLAALLLTLYRWLARRQKWLALLVYSLILLALIPATIYGDAIFLRTGAVTFRRRLHDPPMTWCPARSVSRCRRLSTSFYFPHPSRCGSP